MSSRLIGILLTGSLVAFAWGQTGPQLVPGRVQVRFRSTADRAATDLAFGSMGLKLPADALTFQRTVLRVPSRRDGPAYQARLHADPRVWVVDLNKDERLREFGSELSEDAAYLWVVLKRPLTRPALVAWEHNYADLADVMLAHTQERFWVKVPLRDHREAIWNGGSYWRGLVELNVPTGQETAFSQKLQGLPMVESAGPVLVPPPPMHPYDPVWPRK